MSPDEYASKLLREYNQNSEESEENEWIYPSNIPF